MAQKTITVRSVRKDSKIAFWEKHPRHPNGEVVVYGDGKPVTIGQTPKAKEALGNNQIIIIPSPEPAEMDVDEGDDEPAASADPTVYMDDTELPFADAGKDKDARGRRPRRARR